jgi:ribonuclease HI
LEFEATNNVVEYEALLLGFELENEMDTKFLEAFGDSELIIFQVKDTYSTKSEQLKRYKLAILSLIDHFEAFSINVIPIKQNDLVDTLVVNVSYSQLINITASTDIKMEILYRASILYNYDH